MGKAVEQVAERAPVVRIHPTPAPMLWAVVDHVAVLAQRRELVERAITEVMVEVRAGQYYRRPGTVRQNVFGRSTHAPALTIAPAAPVPVPPSSISQMEYFLPMGAAHFCNIDARGAPSIDNLVAKLRSGATLNLNERQLSFRRSPNRPFRFPPRQLPKAKQLIFS